MQDIQCLSQHGQSPFEIAALTSLWPPSSIDGTHAVFPASATAEGAPFNGRPFPATASAEGPQLNAAPSPLTQRLVP